MFDNIGKKIKIASKILFFLCSLGCVITGIVLLTVTEKPFYVLLLLLGPIVSYLLALLLYGFGEIVEKVTSIDSKIQATDIETKKVNKPVERYWCGKCEHPGPYDGNCPNCGSNIKIHF